SKPDKTTRRVPVKDKICKLCGTPFTPKSNHAKYCSPDCSHTANKENIKLFKKARKNVIIAAKEKPKPKPEKENKRPAHTTYFEQPSHIKPEPFKDDKIPLQIDRRTTIMINKNDDPEEARARYLLKHKM
ncbi:MAG: hypothetical protein U1C59_13840, partial [Methylotenera sp.]|nr:hypothetical protein [Methylotenera sp.]